MASAPYHSRRFNLSSFPSFAFDVPTSREDMNNIWVFLPVVGFVLFFRARLLHRCDSDWREAFLATALITVALTVFGTEVLSLGHWITFSGVVTFWGVLCAGSAVLWMRARRHALPVEAAGSAWALDLRLLLAALVTLTLAIAVIALVAPPNTGDTLEYHMPKVLQWIQNRSVAFFPTAVPRQNHLSPGAEFGILHLQLLTGGDRFANLVEWFSLVGSLIAVSLIAKRLGATPRGQMLAAAFAATLPMGIMQASSTQTDFVAAFWIVCFVDYALRVVLAERLAWRDCAGAGTALGLAVFTKATAYVFAAPFAVALIGIVAWRHRQRASGAIAVFTALFLALNLPHYIRNASIYGSPLGPGEEPAPNTRYAMETHSPAALVSSFAKNVGTHVMTPWPAFNTRVQEAYVAFHQKIGFDLNDPRTSWGAGNIHRFNIRSFTFHDEVDGNPLHLLLAIAGGAVVLSASSTRSQRSLLGYTIATIGAAALFVLYLKWHPWMSRLHLPWFILAAPIVGVVFGRILTGKIGSIIAALLVAAGIPWILTCQERPLVGTETIFNTPRDRQYLMNARTRRSEAPFLGGKAFLETHHASRVGLIIGNSSLEFWWWAILGRDNPGLQFQHVNVADASARLANEPAFRDFVPDALLTLDQREPAAEITVGSRRFAKQWEQARVAIYLPAKSPSVAKASPGKTPTR
jgi:hypothetical protein